MVNLIGNPFQVNTYTQDDQSDPAVAIAPDGSFVVVWESDDQDGGSVSGVFGQRFNADGTPRGPEFQVNVTTDGNQRDPDVAVDRQGNFVVVWEGKGVDDNDGVFARRFDAAGNVLGATPGVPGSDTVGEVLQDAATGVLGNVLGNVIPGLPRNPIPDPGPATSDIITNVQGEFRVNANAEDRQRNPVITMDGNGNFVIAWEAPLIDGQPLSTDIFAQTFDPMGNRVSPAFRIHTNSQDSQNSPQIAMNDGGNIIFTWQSTHLGGPDIFARPASLDGALGSEFQVNEYIRDSQLDPQVVMNQAGDSLIFWDNIGNFSDFSARYFPDAGMPTPEFVIESLSSFHRIAIDGDDNVVAVSVWNGSELRVDHIQLPDQIVIQEETIYRNQSDVVTPDIALNAAGDGAIVWVLEDGDGDGDGDGIFAQRFTTASQTTLESAHPVNHAVVPSLDATVPVLLGLCSMGCLLFRARS